MTLEKQYILRNIFPRGSRLCSCLILACFYATRTRILLQHRTGEIAIHRDHFKRNEFSQKERLSVEPRLPSKLIRKQEANQTRKVMKPNSFSQKL